uniref:Uncharacterized protein n=1 Tax=Molossus molossus TaxID=27622 RepID=A0A7J8EEU3_MOLMO|nr:hypothetical protein HJG59_008884 [Molossus molossus]
MFRCCEPLPRGCDLKRGSRESMSCTGCCWSQTEPRPLWPFSRLDPESPQAADQCDSNLEPGADVKQPGRMTRSPRRQSPRQQPRGQRRLLLYHLWSTWRSQMQSWRHVHLLHCSSCSSGAGGLGGLS